MPTRATFFAAISALLCAATLVLWVRSYRGCDLIVRERGPGDHVTICSEFGIMVFEIEWPQRQSISPGWSYFDSPLPRRFGHRGGLGLAAYTDSARHYVRLPPNVLWGITVPDWFIFLLTAIPAAMWFAHRAAAKFLPGRCRQCGYDLRATPDRCPECGMAVSSPGQQAIKTGPAI